MSGQKRALTNYDKLLAYNDDNSFNISDKPNMWIPDQEKGYVLGEVVSGKGTGKIKFKLGSGEMTEVDEKQCEEANPAKFDGVADMSDLSHLNEASVFHNLRKRYEKDLIHTYSGLFLVVINPYKWLQIYTEEIIHMYQGKRRKEVHPHVYALADEAYRNMLNDRKNQSMLITGESGAGKTENTKKVIQYIANIAGRSGGVGKLEQQILQANPMLEAFGNAKTNKNDNSSRFGKFIRLQFNQGGVIVGTTIQTYLLEKSRVVGQGKGERNFHIFYQIFTDPELKNKLKLGAPKTYSFITGGDCLEVKSLDDKKEFDSTREAMNIIGIDAEEQDGIFRIMAAILHLGNTEFEAQFGGEGCEVKNAEKALNIASELLKVNPEKLRDAIVKPFITAGNERIQKHFSVEQAQYSLKAMCKAVYERVFLWLIQKLNKILAADSEAYFIGVLDIAGFEIFEINSFEQLCINFTNEKLQQFFNQHMFTLEQEEYEREKIEWKFIDFQMDGQDTIDLIEKKPNSILSFLDEESIFPRATNKTLITKLHTLAGKNKKYGKVQFKDLNFKISHYAGGVDYNVDGWIEKNKDPLQDDIEKCIKSSEDYFIANLFQDPGLDPRASVMAKKQLSGQKQSRGSSTGSKGGASFMTVATAYKEQLDDLMDTLRSTYPHFIRCIIPNLKKQPGLLVAPLVLEQLACNGVLEGIRISRKGYPNRLLYNEFVKRYYLLDSSVKRDDPETKEATKTIMKNLDSRVKKDVVQEEVGHLYQFGQTKIFFRHGVLAKLEEYREQKLGQMVVAIQSGCRAWLARSAFKKLGKQTHAAQIIRKNVASWLEIRDWKWWVIFQKIKPLIPQMKVDEEMDKMKEEIKTLKSDLENKTNEANKLNEQLNKTKGDLENTKNELDASNEKLSKLVDERNKLDKENEDLNDDIDKLEEQIRELNRVKLQNEGEIKNLDEQFQTLQQQLENTKKNNEQKILELDRQLEAERGNVSKLEKKVQSLEKELKNANEQLEEAESEKDKLTKENRLLQSYLETSKSEGTDLENTNRNLQKDLNETKMRLEEESDAKQKAEFQAKSFQQKYNDLKTEFEQLESDFEELDSKLKKGGILSNEQKQQMIETEQNLQKLTEKNKSLEKQLNNANSDLSEKEKAYQNLEKNFKKLQFEYQTLQDQLVQVEERANKAENLKKKAESNLKTVTQEKETALNDLDFVKRSLKSAQEEISNLREDLEQEQSEKQINEKQRKNLLNDVEELKKELEQEGQLRDTAESEKKRLQLENEDLKDKVEELTLSGGSGLNEKQTEEINELKKALEKERESRNKSDTSRREYKDKIAKLEQIIEELEKKLNNSEKTNKRLEEDFNNFSTISDRFNKEVKEFLEKSKRERTRTLLN